MSILRNRYPSQRPQRRKHMAGLGDTLSSIINVIGTGVDVAQDPYLPELACRLEQMSAINRHQAPGSCATTASGLSGGVGLGRLMPAVRAYVYCEQNPWMYVLGAAAIIGLPMAIGYSLGKGR